MTDTAATARRKADAPPSSVAPSQRSIETQARRRRRDGLGIERDLKLHVPQDVLDRNYVYRWINDTEGRVQDKTTRDDWDVVTRTEAGEEVKVTRVVGAGKDGKPLHAVLVRKPKEFHDEDRAIAERRRLEQEKAMEQRPLPDKDGLRSEESYIPQGAKNTIAYRP